MQLTKHFHLSEFLKSETAELYKIDNRPLFEDVLNLMYLSIKLEQVRSICFNKPLIITSGYRCLPLNRAVGGSESSDHMRGLAVDFYSQAGTPPGIIFEKIKQSNLMFDQLILYDSFLHFGIGERMRRQCFDKSI